MRHRLPRPSSSTKVRGAVARLSDRLTPRVGLMRALTAVIALTAGAALVLPARPAATADAAMPSLAVARATSAVEGTHAARDGATETARGEGDRHARATTSAPRSSSARAHA